MHANAQRVKEICLQINALEEELTLLVVQNEDDADQEIDEDEQDEEYNKSQKPKKLLSKKPKRTYRPKECCGSVGPRHLKGCDGTGASPKIDEEDDLSDLKPLTGWECMECFAKKESYISLYNVPCEKCGGNLVQKF